MRLGVLDVGSNTVHLLVVDAHSGGHPTPTHSTKTALRLAEHLTDGKLGDAGADALVAATADARRQAVELGCEDLLAFATSAVRDASNSPAVLERVRDEAGVDLQVLSGPDEAALTFLAVRRWLGWSAGHLLVLDIGGGSLEMAVGRDEAPVHAISVPLGAGRLTRDWFTSDPPQRTELKALTEYAHEVLAPAASTLLSEGPPDRAVVTSKTFRSLARLTGAAPRSAGPRVRRRLSAAGLRQVVAFISRMSSEDLAELEGVSASRSHQLVAGAVVAHEAMTALGLEEVEVCPWALREGIILGRLDQLQPGGGMASVDGPLATGRPTLHQAR
ncbi:Ppx/GppA phosphatase [Actinomycetospora succinea]|uniref:Ppx/GppA phosphatase n=1 Tax=Actinomycetospora succinea TaxID=663603 RepID=A0A4R6UNF5_9PSEU|nr:Ppx/GppA phosphatase family protein [Actinomycetospora succinea]TDQ46715.1 Ppx/GppA phosphatase [Actinomycetospora succinea]